MRLILISLLLLLPQSARWNSYADVVFTNGKIVTVDANFSITQALAIKDGKLIAVGTNSDALAVRGPNTKVVDLAGKTVIPGLQDSHIHLLSLGEEKTYEADLTFARNAQDLVRAIADLKQRLNPAPGEWLRGTKWDQYKYPEMVTRWQLDAVAPQNPVRLDRTYRGIAVNSEVFRRMGINDEKPETWPAWWLKDPENFTFEDKIFRQRRRISLDTGEVREVEVPTGVFLGSRASSLVRTADRPYTFEQDVQSVKTGAEEMLRLGVTSAVDPSSRMGYNMRVYQEALNRGWLTMRISAVYEGTFNTHAPDAIRQRLDAIKINNLGNSFLRWRGTKFYGDGGVGSRSAWMSEPFDHSMELEGKPNFGAPVMADYATREAQYRAALDFGWDLHTHACGDQAMRQVVDLYMKLIDEVRRRQPNFSPRWSVIHAYQPAEPKTNMLADMKKYGIIAVPNPVFNWQQGTGFARNIGAERMARLQPFRSYVKSGVIMASGSDYGVTTHNPWIGMYALLTRKDQTTGQVFGPDETLDIKEALKSYTINGAYLTYEENFKGSLEVGKAADLVVLDIPSIDALQQNPEMCFQMQDRIMLTMVEGQARYMKAGFRF
ncbi:MAG: amidohydrolase [Acidobacteria bacterium]|nr:amidohydrolase [Acidobacteriota bacterium]